MFVQTSENKYHVVFELDRRQSRSRTTTCCKIFLLTDVSGPTLEGRGETLQGEKDVFSSVTGCRFALKRALADANFAKSARTLFWKEFVRCHHRVTCRDAFANLGGNFSGLPRKLIDSSKAFEDEARRICAHRLKTKGSGLDWCTKHKAECSAETECGVHTPMYAGGRRTVHGYGGLYSFKKRAAKMTLPSHLTTESLYAQHRHEYYANPHSGHARGEFSKMYGLGWKKIMNSSGETIAFWPRSRAQKNEQYRRFYGMADAEKFTGYEADYSWQERRVLRQYQQQQKTVIVNSPSSEVLKQIFVNKDRIKDIILGANEKKRMAWLAGRWPVVDNRLTTRMLSMSLEADKLTKRIDAKLLKRPGITKVLDDYLIDPNKFVPAFKVGEVVTYKGGKARVYHVDGPLVSITCCNGSVHDVFDHELEKPLHWLRRAGRALARIWGETAIDRMVRADAELPGRGLYDTIQNNHCPECGRIGDFLRSHRGGRWLVNVQCILCNQKYWIDPATRTANKVKEEYKNDIGQEEYCKCGRLGCLCGGGL